MPSRHVVIFASLCAALILAACDAAPGAEEPSTSAPVISDLAYTPELVALPSLPPSDVTEDSVRFMATIGVRATDADGSIGTVVYAVRSPDAQAPVVAAGTLEKGTGERYEGSAEVTLAIGQVGNYTVSVFAVDDSGRMSNTLSGRITYVAEGRPPVVLEVIAEPETIRVDRDSILTVIAVVDDPDGLENVARVVIRTPNGQEFEMLDDGVSLGDPVGGDGEYRARFENVHLATPNTTQLFEVQAFDKTGLSSDIVEKPVRVE